MLVSLKLSMMTDLFMEILIEHTHDNNTDTTLFSFLWELISCNKRWNYTCRNLQTTFNKFFTKKLFISVGTSFQKRFSQATTNLGISSAGLSLMTGVLLFNWQEESQGLENTSMISQLLELCHESLQKILVTSRLLPNRLIGNSWMRLSLILFAYELSGKILHAMGIVNLFYVIFLQRLL